MKWCAVSSPGFPRYSLANVLLVSILIFSLFYVSPVKVYSHSDNTTDNVTTATPPSSDNTTLTIPPSDNVTPPPLVPPSDNVTPPIPPSSDNVTSTKLPASDNVTPGLPLRRFSSDNITARKLLEKHKVFPEDRITQIVTANVSPDQAAEIISGSGKITLKVPATAVEEPVEIELAEYVPIGSSGMRMLHQFELTAANATGYEVSKFNRNLEISIRHGEEELKGLNVDSLRLYYLDEETRQWLPVESSRYDKETKVLAAEVSHFTNYGEQADPLVVGPGRVMAAQVDLHSGTVNFNYPFELPPGPGGFQPKLELVYNSGSVDEMKNKRDVGAWVGTGWSLHLGRITKDLSTSKYLLDLNGASYELMQDGTSSSWYTSPDQHSKVTRSGDTWELRDRDGFYYRFGGTSDSVQYLPSGDGGNYRWDLSQFKDTDGNTANVSYTRSIQGASPNDWVRSAYPEYLTYGNIEVHFISSANRADNPASGAGVAAPKVMEDRRLDSIEIKVNSTLVRKYEFTYNTRSSYLSSDYGGIYYAGKHVLTSVTQVGADGTSKLPPMTFSYQDLQTYRHTNEGETTSETRGTRLRSRGRILYRLAAAMVVSSALRTPNFRTITPMAYGRERR